MKFRYPKTGDVFNSIERARKMYCNSNYCKDRDGKKRPLYDVECCDDWVTNHTYEAARMMGYEVIEDAPTVADDKPTETHDNVDHPAHYNQGGVECIDALKAATVGLEGIQAFCAANAIKYIWRFKDKGGTEDLDKAIWYINRLKEEIGNG